MQADAALLADDIVRLRGVELIVPCSWPVSTGFPGAVSLRKQRKCKAEPGPRRRRPRVER